MRNTRLEAVEIPPIDDSFPMNLSFNEIHGLEGSLWISDICAGIHMFCQVGVEIWAMILMSEGNRNIEAFRSWKILRTFKRYHGSITLTTVNNNL